MHFRSTLGIIGGLMILTQACGRQNLPPASPPPTGPETAPATEAAPAPSATPLSPNAIRAENVDQVILLHEYWLAVATAAGVDPYEMDISAATASADGRLLAVGGCSMPLQADLRSGNVYCRDDEPQNPGARPFLLVLDAQTETVIEAIPENQPDTTIAGLAFTHDGGKLIYAIQAGKFVMWDIAAEKVESVLWVGETSAPRIAVSPDDRWIALKTSDEAHIWDTLNGDFAAILPAFFRPEYSADSRQVAVYHDAQFIVYDSRAWEQLARVDLVCKCAFDFSPDLSLLATSDLAENVTVLIRRTSSGRQVNSLRGGKGYTAVVSFSPGGDMLWRAGDAGDLAAWDTSTWQMLGDNLAGATPRFNVRGFQFTDDGRYLLILSDMHLGLYGLP